MSQTFIAWTKVDHEAAAVALADAIEALSPIGVGTAAVEDGSGLWEVTAYFTAPPESAALAVAAVAFGAEAFVISKLDDTDWMVQVRRELSPVRAGRVVIHGRHDRDHVSANAIDVEIEAAMAFGTGHHGTTEGCLRAMNRLAKFGWCPHSVADIGCGTGILAMVAAKIWPCDIVASDRDCVAVKTAKANIRANGVHPRIQCLQAPGARHSGIRAKAPYDLVLCNILAKTLKSLSGPLASVLSKNGVIILSGLLDRQINEVSALYRSRRFSPLFRLSHREWATLVFRAPPSG